MKIKRLVASVSASFEELVSKVENHQAIADCAIQDVRHAAAKIRGQLIFAKQRYKRLEEKEASLTESCERWRQRALAESDKDEQKALRCVQALKNAERDSDNTQKQLQGEIALIRDLENHLSEVENTLNELLTRRDNLSARSARNKAVNYSAAKLPTEESEGIFSRWEEHVIAEEYKGVVYGNVSDDLDREFREKECQLELKMALEAIREQAGKEKEVSNERA